ncbi:uncharacterized protein KY384_003764 [Bacidia gigantensis]|uniref:uncharacterized protein n=1 Tax=Bacidia gigantensis TaxID=2732470 RepID=UPI001D039185|nr:uncharacterized protein KY384_003764 [Bacidia gigantensis]KAG8532126.1 hypothetical protein KY384_003764 [Bacidia gigantensis]
MASDKAVQKHVPRKAKNFVNAFPNTFADAARVIPTYTPTASILWMGEENVDDELEESLPPDGEGQLDPSQPLSHKHKYHKRLTDENMTTVKTSSKSSKPSKTKVRKSSEDSLQDSHFVNIFQGILADNTQSMSSDTPINDPGWVKEESIDALLDFNQDFDIECQSDSGLHASYMREFMLDIEPAQRTVREPHSLERLRQAYRLWEAQIGGLHETLARVDRNRGAWENFLLDQPKNHWILACFAAMQSYDAMCPGKQRQQQENWIEARQKCKKYKRSLKWIAEMDGSEVGIDKHCHMTIMCWDDEDDESVVWMTVLRSARTSTWLDRRTIDFHTYGIDIRDESYTKCLSWASDAPATIPKERFLTSCYEEDIIWLWEQATHIKYDLESPVLRIKDAPSQRYGAAGAPIPLVWTPTQKFVPYVGQPRENDELWLLKEYLDNFCPRAGDFCTGTKETFP